MRYDLTYYRDVGPSLLSVSNSSRAAAGSVDSPASSPYALAVGAANVSNNSLEPYSSQGPTIDRRVKPDITGFDNVSTSLDQFSSFSGTSAGAPHVAGAAALIKSANSNLDAAQLQAQLESRATGIAAGAPPTNQLGHGLLALGARPPVTAPAGNSYLPLSTPSRVFDSRTRTGGRPARHRRASLGCPNRRARRCHCRSPESWRHRRHRQHLPDRLPEHVSGHLDS